MSYARFRTGGSIGRIRRVGPMIPKARAGRSGADHRGDRGHHRTLGQIPMAHQARMSLRRRVRGMPVRQRARLRVRSLLDQASYPRSAEARPSSGCERNPNGTEGRASRFGPEVGNPSETDLFAWPIDDGGGLRPRPHAARAARRAPNPRSSTAPSDLDRRAIDGSGHPECPRPPNFPLETRENREYMLVSSLRGLWT